jgi:siroheme synthase-like protein
VKTNGDAGLPRLFPVFLKLEGRGALVVGAGNVAAEKIEALLAAGALVTVVAPAASERVRELAASGRVEWKRRDFEYGDVIGARVVIASTSDPDANAAVYEAASRWSIPVNVVDVPELCEFYCGSVVQRGPVLIAISTSGASPSLARRLRKYLDQLLPRRLAELAHSLASGRPHLKRSFPGMQERAQVVDALLNELPIPLLDDHTGEDLRERVGRWIAEVSRSEASRSEASRSELNGSELNQ